MVSVICRDPYRGSGKGYRQIKVSNYHPQKSQKMLFLNNFLNFPGSAVMNLSHTSLITPQLWRRRWRILSAG